MPTVVLSDGRLELHCGVPNRLNILCDDLDTLRHEHLEREKDVKALTDNVMEKTKDISSFGDAYHVLEEGRECYQLIGNHSTRLEEIRAANVTWREVYQRKHVVVPVGKLRK